MASETRLTDAYGELLYAIALADGIIQDSEVNKIKEVLKNHRWGEEVLWSFNYETEKKNNPKESYEKALFVLKEHGPDPEYVFLIEILESVAASCDGVADEERKFIDGFQTTLLEHFMQFLDEF